MSRAGRQPGWWIVFNSELQRLWWGQWGLLLLLVFSLFMSTYILVLAADPEMNVLSQRSMIIQTIQLCELSGMVAILLLGADSFSGERDRGSLESLLLTPLRRVELVKGKLLALGSLWLGIALLAIPYIVLVAKGTDVVVVSVLLLIIPGTLLAGVSAVLGGIVSALSPTNPISFAVAFLLMFLLLAPTQLPASVQELPIVEVLLALDPLSAVVRYQSGVIEGGVWTNEAWLLLSPVIYLSLMFALAPRFLNQRLSLQGGFSR